jgi:hypothetical protein
MVREKIDSKELERKTAEFLKLNSYYVYGKEVFGKWYLGSIEKDGIVEIEYCSALDNLTELLDFREFLEEHSVAYEDGNLRKIKKDLAEKHVHITKLLKRMKDL